MNTLQYMRIKNSSLSVEWREENNVLIRGLRSIWTFVITVEGNLEVLWNEKYYRVKRISNSVRVKDEWPKIKFFIADITAGGAASYDKWKAVEYEASEVKTKRNLPVWEERKELMDYIVEVLRPWRKKQLVPRVLLQPCRGRVTFKESLKFNRTCNDSFSSDSAK